MANSLVGALYIGLFAGSVNPAMPADSIAAPAIPSPQCVVCGPANRVATVYDWSKLGDSRRPQVFSGRITRQQIMNTEPDQRLGINDQQLDRMTRFSGV